MSGDLTQSHLTNFGIFGSGAFRNQQISAIFSYFFGSYIMSNKSYMFFVYEQIILYHFI